MRAFVVYRHPEPQSFNPAMLETASRALADARAEVRISDLRPMRPGMLRFVGFDVLAPQIVYAPVRRSDEEREGELERYARRLARIGEEQAIEVGRC